MPTAPLRPCSTPRCPVLVKSGHCDAHGGQRKAWVSNQPKPKRLRGRASQERRQRIFRRHPLCVVCEQAGRTTLATIADHIVPLAENGADDETNMQGLCRDCHQAKTIEESKRGVERGW